MKIHIPRELLEEMVAHCGAERPNEACGILAAADERIVKVIPMRNIAASPVRYCLDPQEQFHVYRLLDERGWEMGGVFHSHTHTGAFPSRTDVREAREQVPYVIVSLANDQAVVRAFNIMKDNWTDETGDVEELDIHVDG